MASENVGMSNRKLSESLSRRKSKVSLARMIHQGLGGPNLLPEMVRGMDSRLIFRPYLKVLKGDAGK
jgi:hypothetical protein